MVEGPGHVPLDQIEMNMKREQQICDDAPFYILGPIVCDCAPGYDHLTASMGGMMGAFHGAAMLCYVTPKEHIGLPEADDVARGLTAFKIAAHAADIALHRPHARDLDDQISDARAVFDWEKQFSCAIEPDRPRAYRKAALAAASQPPESHGTEFCTMCGPDFCSVRLSAKLKKDTSCS
jgi:phosphomethylpyrimidine synthase